MGEGSLSAEDIDALLTGGTPSGSGSSSGADMNDLDSLLGGDSGSKGSTPSFDAVAAALGPSSMPAPPPPKQSSHSKSGSSNTSNLNLLMDVAMSLTVEFGRTNMMIKDVLHLSEGAVVELDKTSGDDLDLLVNGKIFGKGRLIVLDDFYGIQITQVIDPMARLKEMKF
ncbi:MAG: flagellar motor switch protein FliN [Leptospiraceae bacterium]|nr:flagellar motor switch protein FliN [Leptospiraceae bacterium]MCK6380594.1 flagellar motor switch protein FliN [Leptospiraceae bacterium]NUM42579.1 flagellar motor switch protein FliN [Leptospiraceae bacterium]